MKQRTETDCGLAVLAYLTGSSWPDARRAVFGSPKKRSFATRKGDVERGLEALGWSALPISRVRSFASFDVGSGFAAVFVDDGKKRHRHWVAWERRSLAASVYLMDPSFGGTFTAEFAAISKMTLRSHFRIQRKL